MEIEVVSSIQAVDPVSWDQLVGDMPLLSHAFLIALENSGSIGGDTGWQPCPILLKDQAKLIGAIPLFLKYHSYGEYVFDWAWADAFERHGIQYYPKLLAAIPITPVTSARLIAEQASHQILLLEAMEQVMHSNALSSAHVNFPDATSAAVLKKAGWLARHGVQFRWENHSFKDFDDFLMTMTRDKRKKIRQERKKISQANVTCRTVKGPEITPEEWQFFYRCYTHTYLAHHSTPYLTETFFTEIGRTMPDNIVLFIAYQDGKPIASAFNVYHDTALYGRYWGALTYVPSLHFELCYYQAQMFCIREKITYFEGGAQGEHKLARGFLPRETCSFHKVAHPDFEKAISEFVSRETVGVDAYAAELAERAPYK